jgi:ribonuclease D
MSYKICAGILGNPAVVQRADGFCIPMDPDNRDFVQFVADWQADAVPVQDSAGKAVLHSDAAVAALGLAPEKVEALSQALDVIALEVG